MSTIQAYTKMTAFLTGGDKNAEKCINLPAKVREQQEQEAAKVMMTDAVVVVVRGRVVLTSSSSVFKSSFQT